MRILKLFIIMSIIIILNISLIIMLKSDNIFWGKDKIKEKSGILKKIEKDVETLSAPTGVSASDGTYIDKIRITWNSVINAEKYYVYRATAASGTYTKIGNTSQLNYDDINIIENNTYYYKIKSYSSSFGYSEYSSYDSGYTSRFKTAHIIKTVDTSGQAVDVVVSGNYAYVADRTSGLQIIDISTPASASIIKNIPTSNVAHSVAIKDNYVYMADYPSGLQIIDISTPASASNIKTVVLQAM